MKKVFGKVEALFVNPPDQKISEVRASLRVSLEGIAGDKHYGFVRNTKGSREAEIFDRPKTEKRVDMANWRQWSAVSLEEMRKLAHVLDLRQGDAMAIELASLLGSNLCVSGFTDFSMVAPTSVLAFPSGGMWMILSENLPCMHPGKAIKSVYPKFKASEFPKAAMHIRGLVGNVLMAGDVNMGDKVELRLRQL
ncbi:MAG: hypothetical protein A2V81_04540 [Candidatus Abawacabacteria bacterium RBG_16_42_10]|uniref:MOSC domain-containing protein n=1 Tax=Candidatus Abawacabacteria bacterium RBG_16_42_10 TaxID=1817814 RepID=A0A1F4XJH2_9BACT|nr:MAG: hypothetical protein A2V81_04540 [Candidatus Abawacabacteria bacterium RBG_16_42_10]